MNKLAQVLLEPCEGGGGGGGGGGRTNAVAMELEERLLMQMSCNVRAPDI